MKASDMKSEFGAMALLSVLEVLMFGEEKQLVNLARKSSMTVVYSLLPALEPGDFEGLVRLNALVAGFMS